MNRLDRPNLPIDLAHVPDFALGSLQVRPSSREIEGAGFRDVLEPRIMQVLVALSQAAGAVVSRDDLVRRCWEGRIVGEDAINRCVARIRRLSEADGGRSFTLETIPRVGYRLSLAQPGIEPALPSAGPEIAPALAEAPAAARLKRALPPALVAAGAILVIGAVAALAWWMQPRQWVLESSRLAVATPLIERHPAISPDASMIAYSAGPDIISRKIYVRRLSGGDPIKLTDDSYDDVAPNWTRDGSRIVYVAAKDGEACHIMIIPVPAGLAREVGRCRTDDRSRADWDPSNNALYFMDRPDKDAPERIMRLDLASGKTSEVTHPPPGTVGDQEVSVSPDGHSLGFMRYRNEVLCELVIRDLRTGAERTFIKNGDVVGFAWSDDPETVYVAEDRGSDFAVRRLPLDGGPPTDITFSPGQLGRLSYGAGGLLAMELNTARSNVARPAATPDGPPEILDPANRETGGLSLAPDGTLAMVSSRSGEYGIWLMPPGKPARELVGFGSNAVYSLSWSPDGSRLAGVSGVGGRISIIVLTVGGTNVVTIPMTAAEIGDPIWTADGTALLYTARDAKGFRLWRVELANPDKRTPISDYGWGGVRLRGEDIFAVKSDTGGVWQLGATPRLITPKVAVERRYQWKLVGDDVIFTDFSDPNHLRLRAQPISGGPDRIFAETPKLVDDGDFVVDPHSGAVMYVAQVQVDTDIQLLHLVRR